MQVGDFGHYHLFHPSTRQYGRRGLRHIGLHHHDADTGIGELMFEFTLGVERVGVNHYHARAQGAQAHHQILNQVGHLNRYAITPLKARIVLQPARELRRQAVELGVAEGMPHAGTGRFKAIVGECLLKERHNRGITVGIDARGNTQFFQLRGDRGRDRIRHDFISGKEGGLGMMWITRCGVNLPQPHRLNSRNPAGANH